MDDYKYETVGLIETGVMFEIQSRVPNIPELNQDPDINVPLLIKMHFSNLVDSSKKWNWDEANSYFQTLNLVIQVNQQVNDTFNQVMENAIIASENSTLSESDLDQYIQTLVNITLSNVPYHCQQNQQIDRIDRIIVDL